MPMLHKQKELKAIYIALMLLFVVFLFTPVALLFAQSFQNEQGITFSHYTGLLQDKIFGKHFSIVLWFLDVLLYLQRFLRFY